jgi:hypothetical protein
VAPPRVLSVNDTAHLADVAIAPGPSSA